VGGENCAPVRQCGKKLCAPVGALATGRQPNPLQQQKMGQCSESRQGARARRVNPIVERIHSFQVRQWLLALHTAGGVEQRAVAVRIAPFDAIQAGNRSAHTI
jgi:hypothetical protein